MKKINLNTSILIYLVIIPISVFCQKNIDLKNPYIQYDEDRPRELNLNTEEEGDSVQLLFNDKMLNILFSNKVGTAFGGSNDLTLNKYFASIDAGDNSLSIGVNFENRASATDKLNWLMSVGGKFKAKSNFAVIVNDDGDFQNDNIGLDLKLTKIFNGTINFSRKNRREKIERLREKILKPKYQKKTDEFNEDKENLSETLSHENFISEESLSLKEAISDKHDELYVELAKDEIKYIEDNSLYRFVSDKWLSLSIFIPLGSNTYKVTSDATNPLMKEKFYAFDASLSYTYMRLYSSGVSFFLKGVGSLKNNNNILVENLSKKQFQTQVVNTNGQIVITDSEEGYITNYNDFLTTSVFIEPAFFFLNNTIGLSPAIEFNFGTYNKTNWKFGIPISLKDKDGKPKVNFELQWKEQQTISKSIHLFGISANFQFGDLIN